uniref:Uncharacterized protein n=1 Tax=viral metagenome TaxID=1070528 RepID=A0A6M3IIE4_9ZZZZ
MNGVGSIKSRGCVFIVMKRQRLGALCANDMQSCITCGSDATLLDMHVCWYVLQYYVKGTQTKIGVLDVVLH